MFYKIGTLEDQLKELTRSIDNKDFTQAIKSAFKKEENKPVILNELHQNLNLLTTFNQFKIVISIVYALCQEDKKTNPNSEELTKAMKTVKDSLKSMVFDNDLLIKANEFLFNLNITKELQADSLVSLASIISQSSSENFNLVKLYQHSKGFLQDLGKSSLRLEVLTQFYQEFEKMPNSHNILAEICIEIIENKLCSQNTEVEWIERSIKNTMNDQKYNVRNIEYLLQKTDDITSLLNNPYVKIFEIIYKCMDLEELKNFIKINNNWLNQHISVNAEELIYRLKLIKLSTLSMSFLSEKHRSLSTDYVELSYNQIKEELNIDIENVESFVLDAILNDLIAAEIDQLTKKVRINSWLALKIKNEELTKQTIDYIQFYTKAIKTAINE